MFDLWKIQGMMAISTLKSHFGLRLRRHGLSLLRKNIHRRPAQRIISCRLLLMLQFVPSPMFVIFVSCGTHCSPLARNDWLVEDCPWSSRTIFAFSRFLLLPTFGQFCDWSAGYYSVTLWSIQPYHAFKGTARNNEASKYRKMMTFHFRTLHFRQLKL